MKTTRVTGLLLLAVMAVACAATGSVQSSRGPGATYMLLADGTVHRNEPPPANGFYVLGSVQGKVFTPTSAVLGSGVLGGDGHAGWLELGDGQFYGDESGRAPVAPYIHGTKGDDGVFRPTDDKVIH
jgi:hypothetical protein